MIFTSGLVNNLQTIVINNGNCGTNCGMLLYIWRIIHLKNKGLSSS